MKEVQSVNRLFDIIEAVANERNGLTATQVGRVLQLNAVTVYHLAETAVKRGYLRRDPESKKYRPGDKFLQLGRAILREWDLYRAAMSPMAALEHACNETVYLGVLQRDGVYEFARVAGRQRFSALLSINAGAAHATALGKALLAYSSPEVIEDYIARIGLARLTDKTITDPTAFVAELQRTRQNGYATDNDEYEVGLSCVGAPVRDGTGTVVAALGVGVSSGRMSEPYRGRLVSLVLHHAGLIAKNLGYNEVPAGATIK